MADWLVVGLGNPGSTYAATRHNAGYRVADEIAARAEVAFTAPRGLRAEICSTRLVAGQWGGIGAVAERVTVMKSRSFMNESGGPVSAVLKRIGGDVAHLIVVHDELDLDLDQLRCKLGGGDNGHNGLKSIRASVGSGEFFRVRVGIGRPPGRMDAADYVLKPFAAAERERLGIVVADAADCVAALIGDGLAAAQNRFNS